MFSLIKNHPKAVFWAIIVNVVFLLAMGVSFHFIDAPSVAIPEVKVVKATLKDDSIAQQRLKRQQERERKKELKRKKEKQRLEKLRLKKLKQAELKKKKQAKLAAQKKREQEQAAQRKRIEEENRKQIEAENRRIAEEKERKLREDKLKKELEQEQQRLIAEREARNATIITRQLAIIKGHIEQRWIKPASAKAGLVCTVSINLIPSGEVVSVRYIRRSGDSAFDQSVYAAIQRASPLPLPPVEYGLSDRFREITLNFGKPK